MWIRIARARMRCRRSRAPPANITVPLGSPLVPLPFPLTVFLPVILRSTSVAFQFLRTVVRAERDLATMSDVTRSFLLTPTASVVSEEVVAYTPSEVLYGWASPPPPPTHSPGAVVGRAFPPHLAYEYALKARVERGEEEFYVAVEAGDCVLVNECDGGWALITHEQGVQGWIPSACIDR